MSCDTGHRGEAKEGQVGREDRIADGSEQGRTGTARGGATRNTLFTAVHILSYWKAASKMVGICRIGCFL